MVPMSETSSIQPNATNVPHAGALETSDISPEVTPVLKIESASDVHAAHSALRTPWRWALALLGVACFVLGGIGAVVPGLPTTVFLLVGSFFLTRSCPWLEEKMFAVPILRPYAKFIRSTQPMSTKMRRTAWTCMWVSIIVSMVLLAVAGKLTLILAGTIIGGGLFGTVVIWHFRRAA